jgi:hypothetical protein
VGLRCNTWSWYFGLDWIVRTRSQNDTRKNWTRISSMVLLLVGFIWTIVRLWVQNGRFSYPPWGILLPSTQNAGWRILGSKDLEVKTKNFVPGNNACPSGHHFTARPQWMMLNLFASEICIATRPWHHLWLMGAKKVHLNYAETIIYVLKENI